MTTLFISDLHLEVSRPDITQALFTFLDDKAKAADALYVLGDIFEVWIGDDDDDPFLEEVATRFKSLSDSGVDLFFMVGNRDFILGEDYANRCGATLLSDPTVVDLYGTQTLLMHGDSLCTNDTEYLAFRAQSRHPAWQAAMLSKSLEERRAFAKMAREQSQNANSNKADDIMDVTPEEVVNEMSQHGVTRLIHGHTHRPACHDLTVNGQPAQRWVLGDWDSNSWWLSVTADSIDLENHPISG